MPSRETGSPRSWRCLAPPHTPHPSAAGLWPEPEPEPQHSSVPSSHLVCVCRMNKRLFTPHSVVCHPEKKSDRKSRYLLRTAPGKPVAPLFLQGLSDLKVMDGSQVTMTVQVSGLCLPLSLGYM